MKKIYNILAAAFLLFGASTAAFAQTTEGDNSWFVGAQVGAAGTLSNGNNIIDLIVAPQFGLQVGRWHNSLFGTRFHAMYGKQQAFCEGYDYKFKETTLDADALVNLSNLIWPNRTSNFVDWYGVLGFGVNYSAGLSTIAPVSSGYSHDVRNDYTDSFNGRLGTGVNFNITKNLALNLELQANYKNDLSNFCDDGPVDWQFAALAGVTFKFGAKKKTDLSSKDYGAPVTTVNDYEAQEAERAALAAAEAKKAQLAEARRKQEAEETRRRAEAAEEARRKAEQQAATNMAQERLEETVFFQIRESDPNADAILDKAVAWSNKYPNKKITITGYADKGTGTPAVNKKYAQARAKKVADALKAKGIPSKRLVVKSLGDTVQPFAENDQNRCTIIIGE